MLADIFCRKHQCHSSVIHRMLNNNLLLRLCQTCPNTFLGRMEAAAQKEVQAEPGHAAFIWPGCCCHKGNCYRNPSSPFFVFYLHTRSASSPGPGAAPAPDVPGSGTGGGKAHPALRPRHCSQPCTGLALGVGWSGKGAGDGLGTGLGTGTGTGLGMGTSCPLTAHAAAPSSSVEVRVPVTGLIE